MEHLVASATTARKFSSIANPKEREANYKQIQGVYQDMSQVSLYERIWTLFTKSNMGGIIVNADMHHGFRGILKVADDYSA